MYIYIYIYVYTHVYIGFYVFLFLFGEHTIAPNHPSFLIMGQFGPFLTMFPWPGRGPPAVAPPTHATDPATGRTKGSESHPTDNEQNRAEAKRARAQRLQLLCGLLAVLVASPRLAHEVSDVFLQLIHLGKTVLSVQLL